MQSFDKTIELIESCHVGLCLRKDDKISRDSFPVKVWEYIGLGIPTIVTPKCEAGSFIQQHGCGYEFESGSAEAIIAIILELKNNPKKMHTMSSHARKVALGYTREETGRAAASAICRAFGEELLN
jgi:glycosyltransferase involved in cell wall biosynthesis